ncbi:Uncharacterised protein [Vibrio cholerae]|nr:Uncharacterised protein [Vibrio cholerae]
MIGSYWVSVRMVIPHPCSQGKPTMQTPIFRWWQAIQNLGNYAFQKPRKCCKPQNASVISFLAQVKPRS